MTSLIYLKCYAIIGFMYVHINDIIFYPDFYERGPGDRSPTVHLTVSHLHVKIQNTDHIINILIDSIWRYIP